MAGSPSLSFPRCYMSQRLGPTTPLSLTSRAAPRHPSWRKLLHILYDFLHAHYRHPLVFSLSSLLRSPFPNLFLSFLFCSFLGILGEVRRLGLKVPVYFGEILSLLLLLAQTVLYFVYLFFSIVFSCWNICRLELHPLVFERCRLGLHNNNTNRG